MLFQKAVNNNAGGNNQVVQAGSGYFRGYSVDRHGNIRLPYLGEINVLGYTPTEVRKKIEAKIDEYISEEAEFFVTVKLDGIRYTVMGEVNRPGPKVLFQNRISILEAITDAGDIKVVGDRKSVEIIRSSATGI